MSARIWLAAAARAPARAATIALTRDIDSHARLGFLRVAIRTDLFSAVGRGATRAELVERLAPAAPDLLDGLLRLGVALGELSRESDRYRVRGRRARAIAGTRGDALAALVLETFEYHGSVYEHLPERLKTGIPGDYLADTAVLVARSSLIAEPAIAAFVHDLIARREPRWLLEIGCGSGVYVRHALESSRDLRAEALDVQPEVVALARRNFEKWGLTSRVAVREGDIRSDGVVGDRSFDLITLFNNIYYFEESERIELFKRLAGFLAPAGAVCVVTLTRGGSVASADLDLTLLSTAGCAPLPALDDLQEQLGQAGLTIVSSTQILPRQPFHALVAVR